MWFRYYCGRITLPLPLSNCYVQLALTRKQCKKFPWCDIPVAFTSLPDCRQIGKMLNAREPKIVNGPQILDKYVGESEANIRKLFADAEEEQARVSIVW